MPLHVDQARAWFPAQGPAIEALEREPSQSAAKRLQSRDWGRGGPDPRTRLLEAPGGRQARCSDRPTDGALRAGIAQNLVLPGRAKLSRLAPSLPLRHTPESLSPGPLFNLVGQPEGGQRAALSTRRASVGVWATWEARRACPQRRAVGSQVVQHGGTWHYRLSLSRIELSSRVGRRPASPDWRMPGRGRRARVLQAQEGATWYAPGRPAKVIPLFPETGPPPRVTRG